VALPMLVRETMEEPCGTRMHTSITRPTAVPASAVLSTWNDHEWRDGVHIEQLNALDCVKVGTQNNTYEIIITSATTGEVLVRGGQFFPEFTAVRLAGSTLGGSFLKLRSVHVGFRIEFGVGQGVVVTSPVRTISVAPLDHPPTVM
jgi:hypothetical protein